MPITLNGSGTVSGISVGGLPDGIIQSADLATGVNLGKILQVKQTFKNDTASTSSGSFADISGFTVSITPSATSSKILYTGHLYLGFSSAEGNFRLTRTVGGSATEIGNASVVDNDVHGYFAIGGGSQYSPGTFSFLDSPNTTSAITYGIKWHMHSGTMYLNRTWDNNWFHWVSSITAIEVSA